MAEGARLESVYTGNRIEGSNPSLSAILSATLLAQKSVRTADRSFPTSLSGAEHHAVIQALGVEIRCNTQAGKDVSSADLRRNLAAVVIACGAKRSRALPIPNAEAIGVKGSVDFLRDVDLHI